MRKKKNNFRELISVRDLESHPIAWYLALEIVVFQYGVPPLEASCEMFDTFDELHFEEGYPKSLQVPVWLHMLQPIFYDMQVPAGRLMNNYCSSVGREIIPALRKKHPL